MKLLIFGSRDDERAFFAPFEGKVPFGMTFTKEFLRPETAALTEGYDIVWILTNCRVDKAMAQTLAGHGVRYIVSRAAGSDHMDLAALRRYGLKAANVPAYSPNAISEHTVLLLLSLLRRMKRAQDMVRRQVFTLDGLRGRELRELTVGVFGAGRIGGETIRALHGFSARVLVHSLEISDETRAIAEPVTRERLFTESDALVFHCGLSNDTAHVVNAGTIATMKVGALLVNTARGGLFDFAAVLAALESGKLGGLAFDAFEGEEAFLRKDCAGRELDPVFAALLTREDVVYTAHMSFFTETAIRNMIATSLQNAAEYAMTGSCKNEIAEP